MSLLSILATFSGIIMGVSNLPQAYRIFRRKSAKDISIITYSLLLTGSLIWLFYGIELDNIAIILANGIGSIAVLCVVAGWIKYH